MTAATTSDVLEVLLRAREVLVTKGWTTGTFARNEEKYPCMSIDPRACSFSAEGALRCATRVHEVRWEAEEVLAHAVPLPSATHLPRWNDEQTSIEVVLAAYDRAIGQLQLKLQKEQRR